MIYFVCSFMLFFAFFHVFEFAFFQTARYLTRGENPNPSKKDEKAGLKKSKQVLKLK